MVYYIRIDKQEINYNNNDFTFDTITDVYMTKEKVIEDATRYYGEHFYNDDDYDENFEVTTFSKLLEFWEANDYIISEVNDLTVNKEETLK